MKIRCSLDGCMETFEVRGYAPNCRICKKPLNPFNAVIMPVYDHFNASPHPVPHRHLLVHKGKCESAAREAWIKGLLLE